MHISFINAIGPDFSAMDIGITHLATCINQRTKHTASIVDLTFNLHNWKKYIEKKMEKFKPDIVGFSTNMMYMQYIKPIMREIKTKYRLPIILGGAHASIFPEEVISIEEVDAVCIGDGEFTLAEYLDRLSEKKSFEGIKGIWAKENGRVIKNSGGCFIENIDQFPYPDWDLWENLEKFFYFLGMLYIQGSRGCPHRCTYCDAHGIADAVKGKYFRFREPVDYAREIAYQWRKYKNRKTPPRLAQLFDPVFTIDEKWLAAFCDEYRRQGIEKEFRFSAFSRIDHLNEEKIKMLSKAGCALLRVGIEAGDEYIRKEIYKKRISDEEIKKIFRLAKIYGIGFTAFYILGGPGENKNTLNKTLKLARELDANRSAFFIYKPFTKEGMEQVKQFGGYVNPQRWKEANNITFGAVVRLKDMSPFQIEMFQKKAYFFTFGKRLLRMIARLKWKYFIRLFLYLLKGIRNHLDFNYLMIYFHIYGYDNVDK